MNSLLNLHSMGKNLKHINGYKSLKNNMEIDIKVLAISILAGITLLISLDSLESNAVSAQESSSDNRLLRINVQVTNNANTDEFGSIHVFGDQTGISRDSDMTFPPGKTINQVFEFNSEDIPEGSGFSVELIYGDDISKRVNGVNSQTNGPEIISIVIP